MRRERRPKSKGQVIAGLVLGIVLFLCGFAVLMTAAAWQEQGREVNDLLVFGLFLGCMLLGLVSLFRILGDAIRLDLEDRSGKYGAASLARLHGLDRDKVLQTFRARGFLEMDGGFLSKKIFSPTKDAIHYFVRWVPVPDMETALPGELRRLARIEEEDPRLARKCMCACLFLSKPRPAPEDETALRAAAEGFLLGETAVPVQVFHTAVIVLVDEETGEGRYLELSKGISVYAHGCRLLKKLFAQAG